MSLPYWRRHVRVLRAGRLEWYGDAPTDEFWSDYWGGSLRPSYYAGAHRGDLRDLEEVLVENLDRAGRHVEAGCGPGYWVAALRARGYDITGIESSPRIVEAAGRAYPGIAVHNGDAMALDEVDASLDSYLSFGVVEHRQSGPEPFL